MAGVDDMIARAERDLGLGEPNYIQDWYRARNGSAYSGNFAWCNAAVTKWAYDSGNHGVVCFGTDYAYTVSHADRFRQQGKWFYGASGIRRGDIVFFDWNGTNSISAIDHVGVVTSVSGSTVYTIEGNISNVCARKVRYENTIAGYGRPAYVTSTPPPPTPSATTHTVVSGDTLYSIAQTYLGDGDRWNEIYELNREVIGDDPNALEVGMVLTLPLPSASLAAVQFALTHPAAEEPPSGRDDVDLTQKGLVKVGMLAAGTFAAGMGDQPTKDGYAAWQRSLGYTGDDANGVPGITSFTKLADTSKLFRAVS